MKKITYLLSFMLLGLISCNKWLDINDNPDSANNKVPTAEQRLPSILAQFNDAYESMGTRTSFISQQITRTYLSTNANWQLTRWQSSPSGMAWPWQCWYVNTAVNIPSLIDRAEEIGAYHYKGAGKVVYAMGFINLVDVYGVMGYGELPDSEPDPDSQAFDHSTFTPKFMDGERIYNKCMVLLDEAIADFNKVQDGGAPALSVGDIWLHGDVENWKKLAYGLKARYLNRKTKRADYDPAAVLAAVANAAQTLDESLFMQYVDEGENQSRTDQEALQYTNLGTTGRITKYYRDLLTNDFPGGSGVLDPRIYELVPSYQDENKNMILSEGVDMTSDKPKSGPVAYSYYPDLGRYLNSYNSNTGAITPTDDTVYVQMRKETARDGRIVSTGTYYSERGAKAPFVTSFEMQFIKAEALFIQAGNQGTADALAAYKEGIRQHMEMLKIDPAAITAFLASAAVAQTPGELTISHIMMQKYIAMSYSPENWVDLRRHNYCTDAAGTYNETVGVYKGWKRPSHVYESAYPSQTHWPRRTTTASYEVNYNRDNFLAIEPTGMLDEYMRKPVWWDTAN